MKPFDTFASGTIGGRTMKPYEIAPPRVEPLASASSGRAELKSSENLPSVQVAAAGLSAASRSLKAYEIVPPAGAATAGVKGGGCGCGGKCGPCARVDLQPYPVKFVHETPRFTSMIAEAPAPSTFPTPTPDISSMSLDMSDCARINGEVSRLIAQLSRDITLRDIYGHWAAECELSGRGGRLSHCSAIDAEVARLVGQQRDLEREQAHYTSAQSEWWQISREIDAINDQLAGVNNRGGGLLDMQRLCPLEVAAGTTTGAAYRRECEERFRRWAELIVDVAVELDSARRALLNYADEVRALNRATPGLNCQIRDYGQVRIFGPRFPTAAEAETSVRPYLP